MIDIENENMNQTKTVISGLGTRLKSAREAMSLTTKEAAAHLHLSVNIIDIIEKEQFADGPPPTFMRGYLRSYARLLNVPDHEISKTLKELEIAMPLKNAPLTVSNIRPIPQTDRYLHWITYLIIFTMVILVALWWHSHQRYIITDVPTKTTPAMAPVVSDAPPAAAEIVTPVEPATQTTIEHVGTTPIAPLPDTSEDKKATTPTLDVAPSPVTDAKKPLATETPTVTQPHTSETTPSSTTTSPVDNITPPMGTSVVTPSTATPNNDITPTSTTTNSITNVNPPQIDMPPIISATIAPTADLNQTETAAVKESTTPVTKHIRKHKPVTRHATLPGMPGVNMAMPEPN
jgi:cytoskeleton protein RodZ